MLMVEESTPYIKNQQVNITEDFLIDKFKNEFNETIYCYDIFSNSFVFKPNEKNTLLTFGNVLEHIFLYYIKYAEYSNNIRNEIIYKKIEIPTFTTTLRIGNLKFIEIGPTREFKIHCLEKNKKVYKEYEIFNKEWIDNKHIKNKVLILLNKLLDYMFFNDVLPLSFMDYYTYLDIRKQRFNEDDQDTSIYYGSYPEKINISIKELIQNTLKNI